MSDTEQEDEKIKSQGIILDTILIKSAEAIIGYITIWFFKPVWEKIVKIMWKNKDEPNS